MPRRDFLRHFEGGSFSGANLPTDFLDELSALLPYPSISELTMTDGSEVAVDVAIESHSRGGWADFAGGELSFPLLWRPKLRLRARLYAVKTGEQRKVIRIVQRMSWLDYLSSLLSWKVYLGLSSPATNSTLIKLLRGAGQQLKKKIEAAA